MTTNSTATTVRVIPGSATTYATALRGHLSAALAYMNLGMINEMLYEFDCVEDIFDLLRDKAIQNASRNATEKGDN